MPKDGKKYNLCPKCSGTGFYCMGVINGNPFSYTGFVCYGCNGSGWKEIKPRKKYAICPRCDCKILAEGVENGHILMTSKFSEDGTVKEHFCK